MFIDFAGCMINTNYVISIYKTRGRSLGKDDKFFEINIKLYPNSTSIKEIYDTKQEQEKRFNEIINIVNKL